MRMRNLVYILSIALISCSGPVVVSETTAANDLNPIVSVPMISPTPEPPLKVLGDFSNVKGDGGEHQWGYGVSLWRQDDKILGLVSGSSGLRLVGDSPIGLMENVRFDPDTGKFSFRAKLSLGLVAGINGGWTKDVYEFDGILSKDKLKGVIDITDERCPDKCPRREKVVLSLSKDMTAFMNEFNNRAEFDASVNETLKRRGPKW